MPLEFIVPYVKILERSEPKKNIRELTRKSVVAEIKLMEQLQLIEPRWNCATKSIRVDMK
jgi:hypothetical protein